MKKNNAYLLAATLLACTPTLSANAEYINTDGYVLSGTRENGDGVHHITGNKYSYGLGGGAINHAEDVIIQNANFKNNKSINGEKTTSGSGGAYANGSSDDQASTKIIRNSQFTNNSALRLGGAIANAGEIKEGIINTHFENNKTTYVEKENDSEDVKNRSQGGAIYNAGSINGVGIDKSSFTKNSARYGGAIVNHGTITNINNTRFIQNTSNRAGGAIVHQGKINTIYNSTFSANSTDSAGGAIYIPNSPTGKTYEIDKIQNTNFNSNKTNVIGYGGAIFLGKNSKINQIDSSNFNNNQAGLDGGGILNCGKISSITNSSFLNNKATVRGGAIENSTTTDSDENGNTTSTTYGEIGEIKNSNFTGNKASYGGALYNDGFLGTISDSIFKNNSVKSSDTVKHSYGGAIANIYLGSEPQTLTISNSTFDSNSASAIEYAEGGAIWTGDSIDVTDSTFVNNSITSDSHAYGAAINVIDGGKITNSTFTNNKATGTNSAEGGAIYTADTINITNSSFLNNSVVSNKAQGGAIYGLSFAGINIQDSDFIGNSAISGEAGTATGGAIYTKFADINITAQNKDVIFKDNITKQGETTRNSDIHLYGNGNININAAENRTVSLNNVTGSNTININAPNGTNYKGTLNIKEFLFANNINLYDGTLKTSKKENNHTLLSDYLSSLVSNYTNATIYTDRMNVHGGTINLSNNYIEIVDTGILNFLDSTDVMLDADLGLNAIDTLYAEDFITVNNGTLNIKNISVTKDKDGEITDGTTITLPFAIGSGISEKTTAIDHIVTTKNKYDVDTVNGTVTNVEGNQHQATELVLTKNGMGGLVNATKLEPTQPTKIAYSVTGNETITENETQITRENVTESLHSLHENITTFIVNGNNNEIISHADETNPEVLNSGFEIKNGQILEINDVLKISGFKSEHGGVVYNKGGNTNIARAAFDNNYSSSDGGVINTTGGITTLTDVTMTNNRAEGKGDAIYAKDATININANVRDVEITSTTPGKEVIYLDENALLNLNAVASASENRKITLSGISGTQNGYKININQNNPQGGIVEFTQKVENATADGGINLYGGTLKLAQDNLIDNNILSLHSGTVDMANNVTSLMSLQTLNLTGNTNLSVDVDLENQTMDRISANEYNLETDANINVSNMVILSEGKQKQTQVDFTGSEYNNTQLTDKITTTVKTAKSALYNYDVTSEKNGENYVFNFTKQTQRSGNNNNIKPNNLDAYVGASSALLGGYANQLNTYNTALGTMDIITGMTPHDRKALKNKNKYAQSDTNATMIYSPINQPVGENTGIWFKPYTTIEKVPLKNGPKVSNFNYGGLLGADTGLIDLKKGWEGIANAFIGYTGSRQSFSGNTTYQNGGTIGLSGMLFKNNFFGGLTSNIAYSGVESKNNVGKEDFSMLSTGIAGKAGYNWALADGKFIIQPNVLTSYTFVNTSDYTNAYDVKVKDKGLNVLQVAPGLKLIGNLPNHWQPYATVNYTWNFLGKTKYTVADVGIADLSIKPYIEYGAGVQKKVGEIFTGYAQVLARNGGRNGIGFSLGGRWELGEATSSNTPGHGRPAVNPYSQNEVTKYYAEKENTKSNIKKVKEKKQKTKQEKPAVYSGKTKTNPYKKTEIKRTGSLNQPINKKANQTTKSFNKATNPDVNPYKNSKSFNKATNPDVNPYKNSKSFNKATNPNVNPYKSEKKQSINPYASTKGIKPQKTNPYKKQSVIFENQK